VHLCHLLVLLRWIDWNRNIRHCRTVSTTNWTGSCSLAPCSLAHDRTMDYISYIL
jgi:hypothetical protein